LYACSPSPLAPALAALGSVESPSLVRTFTAKYGTIAEDFACAYGQLAPALADLQLGGKPACLARHAVTKRERATFAPELFASIDGGASGASAAPSHWLARCVLSDAVRNGQYHYPRQVSEYAWADEPVYADFLRATTATAVAAATAFPGGTFECALGAETGGVAIVGVADYAAPGGHMLEFKLGEVTTDATLQLACYLAMRGGGTGDVVSLASRACARVTVENANAAELLATVAPARHSRPQ
jgi:hypothetical protein